MNDKSQPRSGNFSKKGSRPFPKKKSPSFQGLVRGNDESPRKSSGSPDGPRRPFPKKDFKNKSDRSDSNETYKSRDRENSKNSDRDFKKKRDFRPDRNSGVDKPKRSFDRDSDRPKRDFNRDSDRPKRSFDRDSDRPKRSFDRDSERPKRSFDRDSDRPKRSFDRDSDRPKRSFNRDSDRPKRDFNRDSDRPKRSFDRDSDRPKRSFDRDSDRPKRSFDRDSDRPKRSFDRDSDRPKRSFDRDSDRPKRDFNRDSDRPKRSFDRDSDRPKRSFDRDSDRPKRNFDRDSDRPKRSFDRGSDRPKRDFNRDSNSSDRGFKFNREDKPKRSFDRDSDRPKRSFDRDSERPKRSFEGFADRPKREFEKPADTEIDPITGEIVELPPAKRQVRRSEFPSNSEKSYNKDKYFSEAKARRGKPEGGKKVRIKKDNIDDVINMQRETRKQLLEKLKEDNLLGDARNFSEAEEEKELRINRFLAKCGLGSRRDVEELIVKGRITVNGEVETSFSRKIDPSKDSVTVDGKKIETLPDHMIIAFNKPAGYLCSHMDVHHEKTVFNLLPFQYKRFSMAGRLDLTSRGLMIFSPDGDVINRISHPSFNIKKKYIVTVNREIEEEDFESSFLRGVVDGGELLRAKEVEFLDESRTIISVVLQEGKKRQIHRMFDILGYDVKDLQRVQIGKLKLDSLSIAEGEYKAVTEEDIFG